MTVYYSSFWPPVPNALRTTRLSATGGSRTIASMIASSNGGAGSCARVYKYYQKQTENRGPQDFFFTVLGGNPDKKAEINAFYQRYKEI
jgi:hypothetical protein